MAMSKEEHAEHVELHHRLVHRANLLAVLLRISSQDESYLLKLGASCVQLCFNQALGAPRERQAVRAYLQCDLGDLQIRRATFLAYKKGKISHLEYDELFTLSIKATRVRQRETERLRNRLKRLALI